MTAVPEPLAEAVALHTVPPEEAGTDWDAALSGLPGGTFCHLAGWREVMADVLGHRTHYRVALDAAGTVRGLLPLVRVRSRVFGDYLVSMPFLNYGGPLGSVAARRALADDAVALARREGVDLLELRGREAIPAPGPLRRSDRKVTVLLPLPETAEELWQNGFRGKLRSQIRRPQKEGMETRFGPDQLPAFYEVFARNMRDLGTPVLPRGFFECIARVFPGQAVFGATYLGDVTVAAGCGFAYGDEFEITWASSLREYNRLAPNMLLYWDFMEHVIDRGVRVFNFGRCTPGEGTHRFKLQWGGADVPLPWAQWSPGAVDATPSPDRPLFRLATSAWQRLPLPIANRLGPLLSRQIP
ncbi:MAG: FemAB family PEP-CTERM system-associated protein [Gemmatimonadota bacterium]|nr:FemAB family PEP-CTERM system-associated protein [Gemmatimonadota bacterium]